MKRNRVRLTEGQLHKIINESVKKVLREAEDINNQDAFYRVQVCYDDGGESCMPEDFPTYQEALQYAETLKPEMGERVEIYLMQDDDNGHVDFVDQPY